MVRDYNYGLRQPSRAVVCQEFVGKLLSLWGAIKHLTHQAREGVCRRIPLCGPLCDLCASVVSVFSSNSTTETPRTTEFAQRNAFFPIGSEVGGTRSWPEGTQRFTSSPDDVNLATMKATTRELEIVTRNGKPVSVIIPIKDYKELLERAEDAEDIAWLKRARRKKLHYRPLEANSVVQSRFLNEVRK